MAEYIEKKDLLKVLPPKCNMGDMYATAYNTCLNTIENLIKESPTADVVPVVRCKDCKHFRLYNGFKRGECRLFCELNSSMQINDYCSYGERRCSG